MTTYSQYGQDVVIRKFFRVVRPRVHFFVDVGAFDGVTYSNTRSLFEEGWSGLCFEPTRRNYERLAALYMGTRVRTLPLAVSDHEGTAELHVATIPGHEDYGSDVSSLSQHETQRWPEYHWHAESVRVTTLTKALDDQGITGFDCLCVDTEGEDLNVLRGLDLCRFRPSLIVVEHGTEHRRDLRSLLSQYGYVLWLDNGVDLFMVERVPLRLMPMMALNRLWWISSRVREGVALRSRIERLFDH